MPIDEANDSVSPNSAGFSAEGGRAEWLYYCWGDEVRDECVALLGWVEAKGDGRLTRALPRVHPQYPWMVATTVNLRGQGMKSEYTWEDEFGEPMSVPFLAEEVPTDADMALLPAATATYLRYCKYDLQTTFESVPYAVYPDSDVEMAQGSWYDDVDTGTGAAKTFTWANEHVRFVDWPRFPATEFVQYKHGQMVFRTESKAKPHKAPFPGLVRLPLRKRLLKAMWYRVPEHYVTHQDSYLDRFLWRINQNAVTWNGETFDPGELLYAGYSVPRRQVPPFPEEESEWPGFFVNDKILDIELTFLICYWSDPDAPTQATLKNRNFIAAGHNLEMNWADRKPHYVSTMPLKDPLPPPPPEEGPPVDPEDPDALKRYPKYYSCPMELIWTDPAFFQDIGTLVE
jgi:hypothetical protein